jgi:vacuolar-type H+-ATPase subunit E/Vma4
VSTPTPTVEELLRKLREDMDKAVKEGERIAQSAQQSYQSLAKPPRTTTTR